jgi:succinate dehydrogenase/fumarate reductase flavoprotein subunit
MREAYHEVDLCVIGGGMAGVLCAIAAARKNIKVALMHDRPVFGGNASSEIRVPIGGAYGTDHRETGILEEICLENFYRNLLLFLLAHDTLAVS